MKKAILMATFMLSTVSFANETKREGILPKNEKNTDVVTYENLEESLGFCFTEEYVHYRQVIDIEEPLYPGVLAPVMTVRLEVYISGACTTCITYEGTTVDCWGSPFPPIWW